jgi:membrane-associated phospholipid phosphatase
LASAISISRYTGRNHFLSDVLVGSVSGFAIGRYVYKKHHVEMNNGLNGPARKPGHSSLLPLATPLYSARDRLYGVSLVWSK